MKNQLIAHNGSIQVKWCTSIILFPCAERFLHFNWWIHFFKCPQDIEDIPDDLKHLYKTVWEISQKTVLKMAADRGAYIDQSQSLNIHIAEPNYGKLTSMHFYGWKLVSQD